jgi:hypothetical protein
MTKNPLVMNKERLLKLAEHLEAGKFGVDGTKKFYFSCYNLVPRNWEKKNVCGTAGCAIGECPVVFPDDWMFDNYGDPILSIQPHWSTKGAGMYYFQLTERQYEHLFIPTFQDTEVYGGEDLGDDATPEEVAANILAFIELMEEGEAIIG